MKPFKSNVVLAVIMVSFIIVCEFFYNTAQILRSWLTHKRFFKILFAVIILVDVCVILRDSLNMDATRVLFGLVSIASCIYGLTVVNETKE
jgi:ethanolamine ammonia-lyase large subunit